MGGLFSRVSGSFPSLDSVIHTNIIHISRQCDDEVVTEPNHELFPQHVSRRKHNILLKTSPHIELRHYCHTLKDIHEKSTREEKPWEAVIQT